MFRYGKWAACGVLGWILFAPSARADDRCNGKSGCDYLCCEHPIALAAACNAPFGGKPLCQQAQDKINEIGSEVRRQVDIAKNALTSPDKSSFIAQLAQSATSATRAKAGQALQNVLIGCGFNLAQVGVDLVFDAAATVARLLQNRLDQAKQKIEGVVSDFSAKAASALQKFTNLDLAGALADAAAAVTAIPGAISAAASSAKDFFNDLEQAARDELSVWNRDQSQFGVATTLLTGLITQLGNTAKDKILPCFYDSAMKLFAPAGSYPSYATLTSWITNAGDVLKRLFSNPSSAGAGLADLAGSVFNSALTAIGNGFAWLMDAHSQLHALLADPAKAKDSGAVKTFVDQKLVQPLLTRLRTLAGGALPAPLVNAITAPVGDLLGMVLSAGLGGLVELRSHMVTAMKVALPWLLKGAVKLSELPSSIPQPIQKLIANAFSRMTLDTTGKPSTSKTSLITFGTALLSTLAPDLSDTLIRVLDSVAGSADSVQKAVSAWKSTAGAQTFAAILGKAGVKAKADAGVDSNKSGAGSPAAAHAAYLAAVAASRTRSQAAAQSAASTAFKKSSRFSAGQPKTTAAATKATEAPTLDDAGMRQAEADDPDLAMQRAIAGIADQFADAFVVGVVDPLQAVQSFVMSAYIQGLDALLSVVGAVLSAFPLTTTYGPLIVSVVQVVYEVALNAGKVVVEGLIMPEVRSFADEWFHNDLKQAMVDMWGKKTAKATEKRETLSKFLGAVGQLFDRVRPFLDTLKRWRNDLDAGLAGLLESPLSDLFKGWPKPLVAALSRAISRALRALKDTAIREVVGVFTDVQGGVSLTPGRIARAVLAALQKPAVEFMTALVPDDPLAASLDQSFGKAFDVKEDDAAAYIDPAKILSKVGEGIAGAKKPIATYLIGKTLKGTKLCQGELQTVLEAALDAIVATLQGKSGGPPPLLELFDGGLLGVFRAAAVSAKDAIFCGLTRGIPEDQKPALKKVYDEVWQVWAAPTRPGLPPRFPDLWSGGIEQPLRRALPALAPAFSKALVGTGPAPAAGLASLLRASAERVLSAPTALQTALGQGLGALAGAVLADARAALGDLLCRGLGKTCQGALPTDAPLLSPAGQLPTGGVIPTLSAWSKTAAGKMGSVLGQNAAAPIAAAQSTQPLSFVDALRGALAKLRASSPAQRLALRIALGSLAGVSVEPAAVRQALDGVRRTGLTLAGVQP
jgi:hypothetical protein